MKDSQIRKLVKILTDAGADDLWTSESRNPAGISALAHHYDTFGFRLGRYACKLAPNPLVDRLNWTVLVDGTWSDNSTRTSGKSTSVEIPDDDRGFSYMKKALLQIIAGSYDPTRTETPK